jgi:V/A-type H+-transporting ATPase subunit K
MNPRIKVAISLAALALALSLVSGLLLWPAFPSIAAARVDPDTAAWGWGLIAAALATGLSALAAGYAVGTTGAAAIGALAEKPELFGRLLIVIGLAEGIAIYGLIISIMILDRLR